MGKAPFANPLSHSQCRGTSRCGCSGTFRMNVSRRLDAQRILAFPTLADDWGLVVTEAMASGLPVLGSIYSQAVEELVRDGESGWLFRPDSSDDVEAKLNSALTTSAERSRDMGAAARAIRVTEPGTT